MTDPGLSTVRRSQLTDICEILTPDTALQKDPPSRFRVLVVDDDEAVREATSEILAELGYEMETAEDGDVALKVMDRFNPHLVVTDLSMPRMSGFELLEIMRERYPQLPVIAISGQFSGDMLPHGVIADAFLSKGGCSMSRLGTMVAELLSISPMRAAGTAKRQVDHPEKDGDADMMSVFGRLAGEVRTVITNGLGHPAQERNGHSPGSLAASLSNFE